MYKAAIANYGAQIWDQTADGLCRRPRAARTLFICGSNRYQADKCESADRRFHSALVSTDVLTWRASRESSACPLSGRKRGCTFIYSSFGTETSGHLLPWMRSPQWRLSYCAKHPSKVFT
jgi:hypothetical protein